MIRFSQRPIRRSARRLAALGATLAAAALLAAACSSGGGSSPASQNGAKAAGGSGGTSSGVTVKTADGPAGTYLTDGAGRTLYLWVADTGSTSTCSGPCAVAWPPLTTKGTPKAAGAAKQADLSTSKRSDGSMQVTYNGHPLYYFAPDTSPGQVSGQGNNGFGAKWWLVSPSGSAITISGADGSSSSTSGY